MTARHDLEIQGVVEYQFAPVTSTCFANEKEFGSSSQSQLNSRAFPTAIAQRTIKRKQCLNRTLQSWGHYFTTKATKAKITNVKLTRQSQRWTCWVFVKVETTNQQIFPNFPLLSSWWSFFCPLVSCLEPFDHRGWVVDPHSTVLSDSFRLDLTLKRQPAPKGGHLRHQTEHRTSVPEA